MKLEKFNKSCVSNKEKSYFSSCLKHLKKFMWDKSTAGKRNEKKRRRNTMNITVRKNRWKRNIRNTRTRKGFVFRITEKIKSKRSLKWTIYNTCWIMHLSTNLFSIFYYKKLPFHFYFYKKILRSIELGWTNAIFIKTFLNLFLFE